MALVKKLEQLNKNEARSAGGKGTSLGELMNAGVPVPGGFVILAEAFENFLAETDLNVEIDAILKDVDPKKMHTVEDASEKIQALILAAQMPSKIAIEISDEFENLNCEFVAVRSSATAEDSAQAAWAGQLESFLNTTENNLLENVKLCWASLFSPRAIFYRFEKELSKEKVSVAVVVQKMVQSEQAGIAFSVHPVTQDRDQMIIEAGFGLGEAIVSGAITPDSYVIKKDSLKILDKNVNIQKKGLSRGENGSNVWRDLPKEKGGQQVLADDEIVELAKIIKRIENHYGFPVDVEWARERGVFYIVQSRPITTLTGADRRSNVNKIFLTKTFTREHILLYGFAYSESDYKYITELWGHTIKNFLIFFNPVSRKLETWYDQAELDDIYGWVAKQCNSNPDFFPLVKKRFFQRLPALLPYLEGEKKIENLDELQTYFETWLRWESSMESMLFIPDFDVPKNIKKEATEIREKTQHLNEYLDRPIIEFLSEKFPQYKGLIEIILPKEIFILKNRPFTKAELNDLRKRKKGCAIFRDRVLLLADMPRELEKEGLAFKVEKSSSAAELHGTSAFAGYAKGKAKLIMHRSDISKLKPGEILISDMTSPDFVPAIKVAAAIVTDEGGTTCHAAIAAREFKIPCVVGIGSATRLIKNGDLVEVDATAGIVKIIKTK